MCDVWDCVGANGQMQQEMQAAAPLTNQPRELGSVCVCGGGGIVWGGGGGMCVVCVCVGGGVSVCV